MGFIPQVEFQKALRRVEHEVTEKFEKSLDHVGAMADEVRKLLGMDDMEEKTLLDASTPVLGRHGIGPPQSMDDLRASLAQLRRQVEKDPSAARLASLSGLNREAKAAEQHSEIPAALAAYAADAQPFKQQESTLKQILLIGVYETGSKWLAQQEDKGICPLCQKRFDGDLTQHIAVELAKLTTLRASHARADAKRTAALAALRKQPPSDDSLAEASKALNGEAVASEGRALAADIKVLDQLRLKLVQGVELRPEEIDDRALATLKTRAGEYARLSAQCNTERSALLENVSQLIHALQADAGRAALVEDFRKLDAATALWDRCKRALGDLAGLLRVSTSFRHIVDDFVAASIADVQQRFDKVSDEVTRFFEILEAHTPGIGKPVLRLQLDQDRSVVPEVVFYGQATSPAYKYLSESQLNSFGLAVFLASVRYFNPGFRFIILDDVVNSLDGYKRPQLIKILKADFSDSQVLLLTHDAAWRDRLYKELPSWKRIEFIRFDFGTGPVQGQALETLDRIRKFIDDDQPILAGQALGPYMEFQLQEICEAFEVPMKYNRRNEYTLDPLLDGLRVRARAKLGADHRLTVALDDLSGEAGFRNLSAHAKDPAIQLTPQEMSAALQKWSVVEAMVRCQRLECFEILGYTDQGTFRCACGQTQLRKDSP